MCFGVNDKGRALGARMSRLDCRLVVAGASESITLHFLGWKRSQAWQHDGTVRLSQVMLNADWGVCGGDDMMTLEWVCCPTCAGLRLH